MLAELEISIPEFSGVYEAENGQQYECFHLPKDLRITLVAGYNVKVRHAIVKRWQELESQEKPRQLSPAEMFLQSAQAMFAIEKRQDEQDRALAVVSRTIEYLADTGVISYPQIEDGEKSANGVTEQLYRLNKRDTLVVVARSSPEFTARVVDRWLIGHLKADIFYKEDEESEAIPLKWIEQDGGGEGGGEYCYTVVKLGDKFLKIEYSYYSHNGYETEDAEVYEVEATQRLVTFYE